MLCQITMKHDGCRLFASTGAFGAVVGFLISFIDSSDSSIGNVSTILLACDTILNFLLKRKQVRFALENSCSVKLLQALLRWTVVCTLQIHELDIINRKQKCKECDKERGEINTDREDTRDMSIIMMASTICSLILDSTSEEALLRYPEFSADDPFALSQLMKKSLVSCGQDLTSSDGNSEADLLEIVTSGYDSWEDRFPRIKQVVGR